MTNRQAESAGAAEPTVIKKYANRRLYDTATSAYVTLDHLAQLVRDGTDFVVQDAKSGEDITRAVLTQIILEQENRGAAMLPMNFLRQMIRFYGDSMQSVLPTYLDLSMDSLVKSQERLREQMAAGMSGLNPLAAMNPMNPMKAMSGGANLQASMKMVEDQIRTNMGLMDDAMRAWQSAFQTAAAMPVAAPAPKTAAAERRTQAEPDPVEALKRELAEARAELAAHKDKKPTKKA